MAAGVWSRGYVLSWLALVGAYGECVLLFAPSERSGRPHAFPGACDPSLPMGSCDLSLPVCPAGANELRASGCVGTLVDVVRNPSADLREAHYLAMATLWQLLATPAQAKAAFELYMAEEVRPGSPGAVVSQHRLRPPPSI